MATARPSVKGRIEDPKDATAAAVTAATKHGEGDEALAVVQAVPPLPFQAYGLLVAVFLDLVAVAMVIPLLPGRFRQLGVTPATIGVVGSVYSAAQIVGGIAMGFLSDSVLGRRGTLLVSMIGAGVAYYLVAVADSLATLILSRVIVGLVKQTMTASTAIMADLTHPGAHRVAGLSRLAAVMRAAWIVGAALGGWLSTMGPRLPAWAAVGFYVIDVAFVLVAIPSTVGQATPAPGPVQPPTELKALPHDAVVPPDAVSVFSAEPVDDGEDHVDPNATPRTRAGAKKPSSFRQQLAAVGAAFRDRKVARVLCVTLAFNLVERALRNTNDLYLQDRFDLSTAGLASIRTYGGLAMLFAQTFVIGALVRRIGQSWALEGAAWAYALASAVEAAPLGYWGYTLGVLPVLTVSIGLSTTCLSSMYTGAVPPAQRGAMLGALDVLQSAVGVAAPLVGGLVLAETGLGGQPVVALVLYTCLGGFLSFVCFRRGGHELDPVAGTAGKEKTQ